MAQPFTIRIFLPEGDPEAIRIVDRMNSTGIFYSFPRNKWADIRNRPELSNAGVYLLSGYSEADSELPTLYIGQGDNVKNRIDQHLKSKDFWDRAVVFVSANRLNSAHARWLEHALIKKALAVNRSHLENGTAPQEPNVSESEKADMEVFLGEIYETLPLVGLRAFEEPKKVEQSATPTIETDKDTIVVPAQRDGFERVFIGENAWYAIRVSGGMLNKIKYIAAYQSNPISAVTHVARVESIESYGEDGKYRLNFEGPAQELAQPVVYGSAPTGFMQSSRYTSYARLMNARELKDLFN
jgi:hypothetical protein